MASLVTYLHIIGVRSTDRSVHEGVLKADADEDGIGGAGGTCHHASGACHMTGDHVGKPAVRGPIVETEADSARHRTKSRTQPSSAGLTACGVKHSITL
jgi:hypothetical protein